MRPDLIVSLFPCAFSFFSLFSQLLLLSGREANLLARVWGQQRMRLAPFLVCPNPEPAGASSESSAAGGHKKKEKEKGIVKKKTMEKKERWDAAACRARNTVRLWVCHPFFPCLVLYLASLWWCGSTRRLPRRHQYRTHDRNGRSEKGGACAGQGRDMKETRKKGVAHWRRHEATAVLHFGVLLRPPAASLFVAILFRVRICATPRTGLSFFSSSNSGFSKSLWRQRFVTTGFFLFYIFFLFSFLF